MTQPSVPEPSVPQLEAAAAAAQRAIEGVGDQDWSLPSPCEGWTVEDVVRHLVEGTERLAATLRAAQEPAHSHEETSWAQRHRAATAELVHQLRRPGVLDQPVTVPAGTMPGAMVAGLRTVESLVHGWDVATATGGRLEVAEDLVDHAERLTRQLLQRLPPDRKPFRDPVTPPPDAAPLDRLAALLGRRTPHGWA
jgi:uncharacterized protein (TIGR03086 family)